MPWLHSILVLVAAAAFGVFHALPVDDIPETPYDESAETPCEITERVIPEPTAAVHSKLDADREFLSSQSENPLASIRGADPARFGVQFFPIFDQSFRS